MSASTSGAIKAYIESLHLNVAVHQAGAQPANLGLPYVLIGEAFNITPERAFNQLDDPEGHVAELVQLDLWERWRDKPGGAREESYTLKDALLLGLKGAHLTGAPNHVSGIVIQGAHRLPPDQKTNLVHTVITLEVRRVLARA